VPLLSVLLLDTVATFATIDDTVPDTSCLLRPTTSLALMSYDDLGPRLVVVSSVVVWDVAVASVVFSR
jgi:hypothetical protein